MYTGVSMTNVIIIYGRVMILIGAVVTPLSIVLFMQTEFSSPLAFLIPFTVGAVMLIAGCIVWLVGKSMHLAETDAPPEAYFWDRRPRHLR